MTENILVLCVESDDDANSLGHYTPKQKLEEILSLVEAINLEVAYSDQVKCRQVKPSHFFTKGLVERYDEIIKNLKIDVVIVDINLSPVQHRNLEKTWNCKVIDRTVLILEIFADRAQTHEGRLQVELARLLYEKTRLVRGWTHLERQKGGGGFIGGPGETQLEIDRRLIDKKIIKLKRELSIVKKTRKLHRQNRQKVPYPIVALVGYTNAGKSTLFNHLTGASVFVKDMLFATLDPTMRLIKLPSGKEVILSDTVGFIVNLPPHLIAAFRATLEEVFFADILIHVRDISHPDTADQKQEVLSIIDSLLEEEKKEIPILEVLNKMDLLSQSETSQYKDKVLISALSGKNCQNLLSLIDNKLAEKNKVIDIKLNPQEGKKLAWLYHHGHVLSRSDQEDKVYLKVSLGEADYQRYLQNKI